MATTIPIGMCTRLGLVPQLAPGYDYLEPMVTEALDPLQDDEALAPQAGQLASLQPPVRAFNVFVSGEVRLTGAAVHWPTVEQYVARAIGRASALDTRIIVFGSGSARQVPDGFPMDRAWQQLVRFLGICADHARGTGITIAIEPLYNSNIVTSYLEGVELAKEVDREEVMVLADVIHFHRVQEPLEDILTAPEYLCHVHLSDTQRKPPPGQDPDLLRYLFGILRRIDYRGMASVEANWADVGDYTAESARTIEFLRELAG